MSPFYLCFSPADVAVRSLAQRFISGNLRT